jgi:hypothetical protein
MRKAMSRLSLREPGTRRVGAVFALVLFLTLQLFASSESFHKLIHPDADSADHQCAITLFTHGQVNSSVVALPTIVFVAALCFLLPLFQSAVISSFDYRFSASRAPPRV